MLTVSRTEVFTAPILIPTSSICTSPVPVSFHLTTALKSHTKENNANTTDNLPYIQTWLWITTDNAKTWFQLLGIYIILYICTYVSVYSHVMNVWLLQCNQLLRSWKSCSDVTLHNHVCMTCVLPQGLKLVWNPVDLKLLCYKLALLLYCIHRVDWFGWPDRIGSATFVARLAFLNQFCEQRCHISGLST